MEVKSVSGANTASQIKLEKGQSKQQEKIVSTLIESIEPSSPKIQLNNNANLLNITA